MTPEELFNKLKFEVHYAVRCEFEAIKKLLEAEREERLAMQVTEPYMLAIEAAKYIRMPRDVFYEKVREGLIPHVQSGPRKNLFRKSDLDNYLLKEK